jgi:hypothetical protein
MKNTLEEGEKRHFHCVIPLRETENMFSCKMRENKQKGSEQLTQKMRWKWNLQCSFSFEAKRNEEFHDEKHTITKHEM